MSVLVYKDPAIAGKAAATIIAANLMENPYANIGIAYDSLLEPVFEEISSMLNSGLFSLQRSRLYQLCEFVPTDENPTGMFQLLYDAFLKNASLSEEQYVIPYVPERNWAQICSDFENDILDHGGLDLTLLALKPDGSVLYNLPGSDLAPVTHVETIAGEKVVSAGMSTIMRSKKILVVATGDSCADSAVQTLGGTVNADQPFSYLQLHRNITFIMDEKAAALL